MKRDKQAAWSGETAEKNTGGGREIYEWVQALVCSVLAVVLLFTFVMRLIGVDGHSMVPTLQDGDRLLVLNAGLCGDYRQEGSVFVIGDNRNHSNDSRDARLGTVDTRYLIGRAVLVAFPGPDAATGERNYRRIGGIA